MRDHLEKELEKIGLSEKEAKVYLAALELGPSTAQTIAAKATVNRPTTYIMIESLIKRGLMSSFEKGKKRYFVAGKPAQLLHLIGSRKRELDEQEKKILELIPVFQNVADLDDQKPTVQVFEGSEATKVIQTELLEQRREVLELVPLDVVRQHIPPISPGDTREKFAKLFHFKSLYSTKLGPQKFDRPNVEYRFLDPEHFPIASEVLILETKIIFTVFLDKQYSIHIGSREIADTMRTLFFSLWVKARK
jgi:sugar-specific transcriptional regulator TrmB